MVATARIDELRSKFDENPRRYFAPLANEYRKAGDLSTAIAICRTQLRQFPAHMSGHVVLGQALYEAGELVEARSVFEKAVELDPENLIALRHLGDIARATGDGDAASSWYRRVLDADPYNEPIAALLADLAEVRLAGQPRDFGEPIPEPAVEPEIEREIEREIEPVSTFAAPAAEAPSEPEPAAEESAPAEFVDLSAEDFRWAPPVAAPVEAPPQLAEEAVGSIADATGFDFVDEWVPETAAPAEVAPAPELSSFDPVVGLDLAPAADAATESLRHSEPLASPAWPEEDVALDLVTSGAFATETMAELCLEQGHDEQALAIFEQLLEQRPGDASLAARVESLRARLSASAVDEPSAGEFLRDLAERQTDETPNAVAEPIEHLVAVEVAPRDAWAAAAWRDAFRLGAAPEHGVLADVEARGAASASPAAAPSGSAPLDLSFDRFFAGVESVEAPVPLEPPPFIEVEAPTPSPASAPATAPRADVEPTSDEDDLAEFNAWLRGVRDS